MRVENIDCLRTIWNHGKRSVILGRCLRDYMRLNYKSSGVNLLAGLTEIYVAGAGEAARILKDRAVAKSRGDGYFAIKSATNSMKRTGGVVYEQLVRFGIAYYLHKTNSEWYVEYPFSQATRSIFSCHEYDGQLHQINPDLDVLLRRKEQMVLLSTKTSIADRGAGASHWKRCIDEIACARGIDIKQALVTSDTYKGGEILSKQVIGSTYLFKFKFTTKNSSPIGFGWKHMVEFPGMLEM